LLCILLVIRNYKNKPKIFTISFLPILVAVVIELMLFYSKLLVSIGTASSVGVLIFICMQMYAFTSSYLYIYKESLLAQKHKKMAYTDSLTELPNRTAFDEQVNFYKKNIKTYNCIWCISIDINDLKYVNDNFGHSQGDKLIRETATIIYDCFSSIGRVYRIGGDEFNILLENHSENIIKNHIKMIFNSLDEYNRINELQLGIALGYDKITVALSEDIDRLIKKADGLMYENKRNSKSLNSKVELDKISNDSIC
ncbi:MAG: GGDEF domain-containing protein, partial [Oscillospiraceae bacterium]